MPEDLMQYLCPERGLLNTLGCFSESADGPGLCRIVVAYRDRMPPIRYRRHEAYLPTAEAGPLADRIDALIQSHRRILGEIT